MKLLIRFLLLVLPLAAAAQSKLPPCPAFGLKHNCFGGSSIFTIGERYVGEWKDGKPHGQGAYTVANGNSYVGEFRDSKPHGQGALTFVSGSKYVGEFKDGELDGQGTYAYPDGGKYVGEFKNGRSNGQGIEYRADGAIDRSGRWVNGVFAQSFAIDRNRFPFHGSPQLAGSSVDAGRAERDRLAAAGQSQLPPCPAWGGYKHNCFGAITFGSGDKYVGEWGDGSFNGQGTFTFANGRKYVGEFRDGKYHGQGIEYRADGAISRSGQWVDRDLAQSFAIDRSRFPFDGSTQVAGPSADSGRAERDRLAAEAEAAQRQQRELEQRQAAERQRQAAEAEAARRKQQELELKLAAEARERERQAAEAEAARRRQQELEQRLAAERDRQAAEAEATRRKQQDLEQRLATEAREREMQAAEADAARLRQQELEQRLTAEARERERQAAEAEVSKRRQQELETQLAAIQSQSKTRPSLQAAVIRNAHALVIGNAAYPGSMRLANPVNDANAISQKLRALGFTVTTVTDMNRQRLVQAMTQFRRSAASADLTLLFYAGHGVQIFGTNYILPTDIDQSDVAQATIQGVSLNSVLENFLPGKTKLVFLDACRDNPLMNTGDRSVSRGLAPISVAQGTLISYATKDGQTALDGFGSRNSPFTTALLEHLGDPNDIAVVLRKVREKVMQATGGKQQPWEYGSLTGGELVLSAVRRPER